MVVELVGRARRRHLWNELLAQGAWAVSAALAAVIVLLLLGTEVLDWRWMAALPAATLAAGVWLALRRLPPAYTVAQAVDHRLRLADALSTALYFAGGAPDGVREAQRAQAERLARGVDVRVAVPFTMPRAVYSVAILGVAASGLFALRYGISHRLDLRQPLASILQQAFGLDRQQAAALERRKPEPLDKRPQFNEMQALAAAEGEALPEGKLEGVEAIDASGSPADRKTASRASGNEGGQEGDEMGGEEGQEPAGFSTGNEQGRQGQGRDGKQSAARQGPGESGGASSLLEKFREAMQNLMSRMRPPSAGSQGGQPQQAQNGQQGQPQAGAGQPGREGRQQAGGQQGEGQEGQQGSESQTAQNASGRGSGQSGDENPSQQPGSGIGKQDGDKELRNAEQLAAMGKISEIIGKRSANVTGEVTVEVQSGSQQLQTPYSRRRATQGEAIAEISRDEVPVALESYVQQYFEQVRKAAPEQAKR